MPVNYAGAADSSSVGLKKCRGDGYFKPAIRNDQVVGSNPTIGSTGAQRVTIIRGFAGSLIDGSEALQ